MRVLVVDDEAPARRKVVRFLGEHGDVEIVGEAANGREAVDRVASERPDLVFLDVQMPDMDGLEAAEAIAAGKHVPQIVFVTAFDHYAVRAFEVNALDYLLKPFDRERFDVALERARKAATPPVPEHLMRLLDGIRPPGAPLRRLLVSAEGRSHFVPVSEIARLESDRNNVVVHARGGSFSIRATLDSLESKLDAEQFARIHRSHIVSIDAIKEIHPWFHGDFKIVLRDGSELPWSRRYAAKRPDLLG